MCTDVLAATVLGFYATTITSFCKNKSCEVITNKKEALTFRIKIVRKMQLTTQEENSLPSDNTKDDHLWKKLKLQILIWKTIRMLVQIWHSMSIVGIPRKSPKSRHC